MKAKAIANVLLSMDGDPKGFYNLSDDQRVADRIRNFDKKFYPLYSDKRIMMRKPVVNGLPIIWAKTNSSSFSFAEYLQGISIQLVPENTDILLSNCLPNEIPISRRYEEVYAPHLLATVEKGCEQIKVEKGAILEIELA
jgi:hypothetical protein